MSSSLKNGKTEYLYLHVCEKRACMQKISILAPKIKKVSFFSEQMLKFALSSTLKIEKLNIYIFMCEKNERALKKSAF